jgi:hypothetical protein
MSLLVSMVSYRGFLLSDVEGRGGLEQKSCQPSNYPRNVFVPIVLTLMPNQSLRANGSWVFFLRPFLPFDNLLFLHEFRLAILHPSVIGPSNSGVSICATGNSSNVLSDSHLDEHLSLVWTNRVLVLVVVASRSRLAIVDV